MDSNDNYMKRIILLLCFIPLYTFAGNLSDEKDFIGTILPLLKNGESLLRLSPEPVGTPDSMHIYNELTECIKQKEYYKYDSNKLTSTIERYFSPDEEVFHVNVSYIYPVSGNNWIVKTDSVIQNGKCISAAKYARTFNDNGQVINYHEYYAQYGNSWGEPIRKISAVTFDNRGNPLFFMDTIQSDAAVYPAKYIVRQWRIMGQSWEDGVICHYPELPNGEWQPETKYDFSHVEVTKDTWEEIIDVAVMNNGVWAFRQKMISTYSKPYNTVSDYKEKNESGAIQKHYTYRYFYPEPNVSNNTSQVSITAPKIQLNNMSHSLMVDLRQEAKADISIITATGRIAMRRSINQQISELPVKNLAPGYYIVCLLTAAGQYHSQAIIIR